MARAVMYWTLGIAALCIFMLNCPPTTYTIAGTQGPITFST